MIKNKRRFQKTFNTIMAGCLAAAMLLSTGCGGAAPGNAVDCETVIRPTTTPAIYEVPETEIMASYAIEYEKSESLAVSDMVTSEEVRDDFNTEEYNSIKETGFLNTLTNPLSTFSIDVDTASYTNIRRMINEGTTIVGDAIRLEEFLNYFNYDYKTPTDDAPFGVTTEMSDCPWNPDSKLLLIGLQAEEIDFEKRPASNFVFLLDVSGSMNSANKLPLMQKAFSMLAEELDENDRVSIVTYAGRESVILEGAKGSDLLTITTAIENLQAGGSTAGAAGINKAYEIAEKYFIPGGNNRIILATDGDLNVGVSSEAELTTLISDKRESGIYLSVLGFGTGNIKDNKMEALADNGNGNYSYIDSIFEAKKVLVNEMGGTLYTVAKDVKLQVEFNPAKVAEYRLIGYENRRLEDYEFNDDTVDAGEIGSGHNITAVYELVLSDKDQSLSASEYKLKYQTAVLTDSDDLLTLSIRYKEPDEDTSKLLEYPVLPSIYTETMPDNLKFAACVLEFGMLLKNSEYMGTATYDDILTKLNELGSFVNDDPYKKELRELVTAVKNNDLSTPSAWHEHQLSSGNNVVEHEEFGYCGNTITTIAYKYFGKGDDKSWTKSFMGGNSVALTDLLRHLDYKEGICRCLPEYTVDTEFGTGYGINLTEGYARYNGSQVSLTAEQVKEISSIMEWAATQP